MQSFWFRSTWVITEMTAENLIKGGAEEGYKVTGSRSLSYQFSRKKCRLTVYHFAILTKQIFRKVIVKHLSSGVGEVLYTYMS